MPTPDDHETTYPNPQAREAQLQQTLTDGIQALAEELVGGKSDHLLRYLDFMARFHTYSPTNQMLIALQCPEATQVAGLRAWGKMGYRVAKGTKGIRILAPVLRDVITVDDATGEERVVGQRAIGFTVVTVFDVHQLNQDDVAKQPLPVFFRPLGSGQEQLATQMETAIRAEGIEVVEERFGGDTQGVSSGGRISLLPGLDATNRVHVLAHEWAHELLHRGQVGRLMPQRRKELQAETVAYVVAHHFGVHNPFSADYLQAYGNSATEVYAALKDISAVASYMIAQIEQIAHAADRSRDHQRRAP